MKKYYQAISFLIISAVFFPSLALGGWSTQDLRQFQLPGSTIYGIIFALLNWLLGILSFLGIIGFVISGIQYLTAAGDEDRMETAKKAMYYSVIGVIVGISGYVAIQAAYRMLSGSNNF